MSNLDEYFHETKVIIDKEVLETIKTTVSSYNFIGNANFAINYSEPIVSNFKFNNLLDNFLDEFSAFTVILKINPYTHVPWHFDESSKRRSTINIILDDYCDNATYFTDAKNYQELNYNKFNTWVCPYKYQTPMIVNVAEKLHCVFNCNDSYRLVLSICSDKISHYDTIQWFKDKENA